MLVGAVRLELRRKVRLQLKSVTEERRTSMNSTRLDPGFHAARENATNGSNAEDAALWRWFCEFFEEGRVRWCRSAEGWLVSVDHKHLSTEPTFYDAIRIARERSTAGKRRACPALTISG